MPPEAVIDEEDYASSEDSDFAPDDAPDQGDGQSSDSEGDGEGDGKGAPKPAAPATKRKRHRQTGDGAGDAAEDLGFENSGDEAIIEKGKKRRKKGPQARQIDDEGGEGGLIKTRSMRAVEKAERKAQVVSGPVTVDVDALWASMAAAPVVPAKQAADSTTDEPTTAAAQGAGQNKAQAAAGKGGEPGEMVRIKRTYNFAGKVHTEEKLVPRESAEARLYLASQAGKKGEGADDASAAADDGQADDQPDRRMPRRAFRSAFEPVVIVSTEQGGQQQQQQQQQLGRRTDLNLGMAVRMQARQDRARKVNVVEKSRMDWAGFVDKEGIKDELALAGKAKGSFADRQDFLARSEARREEDARRVRMAGKV
ncbi:hypothetical protein VPNG_00564 [Cytospora leucostoma]|uniref:SWR1-complex protein 5 n=1 Tax=Cytospora leucostoma TaxID=1230097 RepID=A0A423XMB1_9PEZI|nr:hypothetical protein VPNG_00564 [Cytospora leucostoma]